MGRSLALYSLWGRSFDLANGAAIYFSVYCRLSFVRFSTLRANSNARVAAHERQKTFAFRKHCVLTAFESLHQSERSQGREDRPGDNHLGENFAAVTRALHTVIRAGALAALTSALAAWGLTKFVAACFTFRADRQAGAINRNHVLHSPRQTSAMSPMAAALCHDDACGDQRTIFDNSAAADLYRH